jgi:hypothetical protein
MSTQTDSISSEEMRHPAGQARARTNSNSPRPTPSLLHQHNLRLSGSLLRRPLASRPLVKPPIQVKPLLHSVSPQTPDRQRRRSVRPQVLARRHPLSVNPQGWVVAAHLESLPLERRGSASRQCQALEAPLGKPAVWDQNQHSDRLLHLVPHQHSDKLLPPVNHLLLAKPVLWVKTTALLANRHLGRVALDRQHNPVPVPRRLANSRNRVHPPSASKPHKELLLPRRLASKHSHHSHHNSQIPLAKHRTRRQLPSRTPLAARRRHRLRHSVNQARPPSVRRPWVRRIRIQAHSLQIHSPRRLN